MMIETCAPVSYAILKPSRGTYTSVADPSIATNSTNSSVAVPRVRTGRAKSLDASFFSQVTQPSDGATEPLDPETVLMPCREAEAHGLLKADLLKKIVETVENYFSDDNLRRDSFLRKHVRRNKEGLVSLKLVSSFRKVKSLTKDWRIVAYALRKYSQKLEINHNLSKLRRLEPLPDFDDVTGKLVAYHLPLGESATLADVEQLFSTAGTLVCLDIFQPSDPKPEYLKNYVPESIMAKGCIALVQYKSPKCVLKAIDELAISKAGNWRENMQLVPLDAKVRSIVEEKSAKPRQRVVKKDGSVSKNVEEAAIATVASGVGVASPMNPCTRSPSSSFSTTPSVLSSPMGSSSHSLSSSLSSAYGSLSTTSCEVLSPGSSSDASSSCSESDTSPRAMVPLAALGYGRSRAASTSAASGVCHCHCFAQQELQSPTSNNTTGCTGRRRGKASTFSEGDLNRVMPQASTASRRSFMSSASSLLAVQIIRPPHGPDGTRGFKNAMPRKPRALSEPVVVF